MDKVIAFFDFDGTITKKDSMIEFIRFCFGDKAYYTSLVILSPYLAGMKLGVIPNSVAKEKLISHFFKGMLLSEFNDKCLKFSETRLSQLIREDAMESIREHQRKGHEVVVVSASAENWIRYWCERSGISYLGTRLQVNNEQRLTGKLEGTNCNGQEKINRILEKYDTGSYHSIYCYGDSKGDRLMLSLATHPFYRYFTK